MTTKQHTMRTARLLILVLTLLAAGLVALPASSAAPGNTVLNYWETPCQTAARAQYGVPVSNGAMVRWQLEHRDTPTGQAYNQAAIACVRTGWNDPGLVLVHREVI